MVRLAGVHYAYGGDRWALRDIDLEIGAGEFVLVVGPSGSGKSTLLRCLNGLIPHFYAGRLEGRVEVVGRSVADASPAAMLDAVGLVPQNPAGALFCASVEEEIAFGLESLGLAPAIIRRRVQEASSLVGLADRLDLAPFRLSGGEQQRLLIATALATEPAVLALDEPFAQLDPEMAETLAEILSRLVAAGTTVIVAEHRLGPLLGLVDRLVVMEDGRLVADGSPEHVVGLDLFDFGVNLPLAVRLGLAAGLDPPPLTTDALRQRWQADPELRSRLRRLLPPPNRGRGPDASSARAIEMDQVTRTKDGRAILADTSLSVAQGEVVALLGHNGAGKTTLLRLINGLERPSGGTVRVADQPVLKRRASEMARWVGSVFQNPNDQFFQASVRDELGVGPRALGLADPEWLAELVSRFRLEALLERSPFRLSEGEKKRVTFAAALASQPRVLLLDEPSTGQDERFRAELVKLARECASEGRAVLLATHDTELADEMADRWIVLNQGQVVAAGPPEVLFQDAPRLCRAGLRPGGPHWLSHLLDEPSG